MERQDPQVAEAKVSGPTLPLLVGAAVAIGLIGFAFGASVGGIPSPASTKASASASAEPSGSAPITASVVSPELWSAYLNGADSGWALCAIATEISCAPVDAQPSVRFADFFALPFHASARDWDLLDPTPVQPAHYVVAGPITLSDRQLIVAVVSDDGVATLLDANPQAWWNGIIWADLGEVGAGRYLAVAQGISLSQPDAEGRSVARGAGFVSAFVVATPGN
ncbi:MAG TPA: hypothetical protein VFX74_01175 [Candidatus Limnocylindria bacterium]|jgi:hypothetical protein|nr:hypothetical protein [Candidatus Limnocylindria bacterium]